MSESDIEQAPQEPWDLLLARLQSSPGMSTGESVIAVARVLAYLGGQVAEVKRRTEVAAAVTQLDLRATALSKARKHVAEVAKTAQTSGRYSESSKLTYKDQLSEELRVADFLLGKRVV